MRISSLREIFVFHFFGAINEHLLIQVLHQGFRADCDFDVKAREISKKCSRVIFNHSTFRRKKK